MEVKAMREGVTCILGKTVKWKRLGSESNQTLVLLHGLGRNMNQWNPVAEALSEHFDVFLFDLPGYGGSQDFEPTEINITFPIWMMDRLFEKIGISNIIVAGESFGGLLALEYALKRPENVSKLVLMDSAGLGREICLNYRLTTLPAIGEAFISENIKHPGVEGIPLTTVPLLRILGNVIRFGISKLFRRSISVSREEDNNLKLLRYGVGLFGQKTSIRRDGKLKNIKTPTLIFHALDDAIFPSSQALRAYRCLPNAWGNSPVFFKQGGHFPLESENEEIAVRNVKTFVNTLVEFAYA